MSGVARKRNGQGVLREEITTKYPRTYGGESSVERIRGRLRPGKSGLEIIRSHVEWTKNRR